MVFKITSENINIADHFNSGYCEVGKLLTYLSCYVLGIFMILVVLCIIVSILDKSVTNMLINIAFGVIAYGMVFAIAICCEIIAETNGKLIRFLAS